MLDDKERRPWVDMTLVDITALLYAIWRGRKDNKIGYESATQTIEQLTHVLNRRIKVPPDVLENAIWSVNLIRENKSHFWHPLGVYYKNFLLGILNRSKYRLDLRYHTLSFDEGMKENESNFEKRVDGYTDDGIT